MSKEDIKWTTKDGKVMFINDMDENHAKNALRMMIRRCNRLIDIIKNDIVEKEKKRNSFEIHGDIAQDHIDQMQQIEYEDDMGYNDEFNHLSI